MATFVTLPVKPDELPPHLIGNGCFSLAVGIRCVDCHEEIKRFDVLSCCEDLSFQIVCPMCGHVVVAFEQRSRS